MRLSLMDRTFQIIRDSYSIHKISMLCKDSLKNIFCQAIMNFRFICTRLNIAHTFSAFNTLLFDSESLCLWIKNVIFGRKFYEFNKNGNSNEKSHKKSRKMLNYIEKVDPNIGCSKSRWEINLKVVILWI